LEAQVPDPPRHLTVRERELWDYYAPLLGASRVMTAQDRETLVQFCESRAQVMEIKQLQADPAYRRVLISTLVDGAGNEKPKIETNPLDAQRRAWTDKARLCAAELGLSPMSRARVSTVGPDERDADPLESLLKVVK
jgi:P27 family predicted phage terminase small subunit